MVVLFCCCPYRRLAGKSFSYRGKIPTAPPGWLLLSLKEGKKQEGSVQFSTPPMQQNEGVYISPLLAASTNHVAFYSSIITGFEGRKKRNKTFHVFCRSGCVSRMFSLFAGLKKCCLWAAVFIWMQSALVYWAYFGAVRLMIADCSFCCLLSQLHLKSVGFPPLSPLGKSSTCFMMLNAPFFWDQNKNNMAVCLLSYRVETPL